MTNGKHSPLLFYVYYNKTIHKKTKVVMDIIDLLREDFGNLAVYMGMEHTFLCMNVRMREDKKINIEMKDK